MFPRLTLAVFLLGWVVFVPLLGKPAPVLSATEQDRGLGGALARLTSWALFNGGRAPQDAPVFVYGYLSQVNGLPQVPQQQEDKTSSVLTFVVEGTVVDLKQSGPVFMVESRGTLRVFFDSQAKRDFTKPESFRSGEVVATYNLRRSVFFNPASGWLYDRSFAGLVSSKPFTFKGVEVDLLSLWGAQLVLQAQARPDNALPSPLPDYTAAIPYTGALFVGGERTEHVPYHTFLVRHEETHPR